MDIPTSLSIVGFAALIHASFQLSVSVLTLLSSHTIGSKQSHRRLIHITTSYIFGVGVMTLLLVSFTSLLFLHFFGTEIPLLVWALICGLVFGVGIAVWLFYYRRRTEGTELWLPRSFARFLTERSKKTTIGAEAFSLGLTSVIAEIIFIIPTICITAMILLPLPNLWQLAGIGIYTLISLLGLVIAWSLIGSGHSLARIQQWRQNNKRFLQFSAGSALIVLGFFVYVSKIISTTVGLE